MKSTILCVDDERMVLVSLKEQLARHFGSSVRVETAESGMDALDLVQELIEEGERIPLVISDHLMPGIKGDELLTRIHAMLPETLTIMLTGEASASAVGEAVNSAGLYRFIGKPWGQDDLVLTVREALASYTKSGQLSEQTRLLTQMYEVALDLTANLAADDRYSRLLASAVRVFPAEDVFIHRVRDGRLDLLASTNEAARPSLDLSLYPELLATSPADSVRLRGQRAREDALVFAESGRTYDAHLRVPLSTDEGTLGLVSMFASARDAFEDVTDARVMGFASLVAASIRTTELVDQIEQLSERRLAVAQHLNQSATDAIAGPLQGESREVQELRRRLDLAAQASDPVLLIGPTGAGSEVSARWIHDHGARRAAPFIVIRCAGIENTDEILAHAADDGIFRLADGGTLFFDHIDRLSQTSQQRLVECMGDTEYDVRVIAAMDDDLTVVLRTGEFDVRLARALESGEIAVPSLRQRATDIPTLANYYLHQHAARLGQRARRLSDASLGVMESYRWPGNIHELSIIMERAVMTAVGEVVDVDASMLEGAGPLGAYRLIERIGRGGMGEVWRAQHQHLARPAAIKLIRSDVTGKRHNEMVRRFRREAEATARLRSPHTVELYDFGISEEGAFYYVMEMLEGHTLDELVKEFGPLPHERTVYLLRQMCLSLGEAHEIGLVHRDIKPANAFVSRLGGEYDFLKVLDFGMVTADDPGQSDLTGSAVHGTPAYIAPELIMRDEFDGRADIYCLGLVAYYLATGQTVFGKGAPIELFLHHVRTVPTPPSQRTATPIPASLEQLILDCLQKDPAARPGSAEEVIERLDAIEREFAEPWTQSRAKQWWEPAASAERDVPREPRFDRIPTTRVKAIDD